MVVHVNNIDLYYEKSGSGRPLVMIHGNGEDHTIFDKAVSVLQENFTCYCPDSRGHGQSSPVREFHYDDMADDVICFLEELDLRDAVLYGFSDGGIIGLLAASRCERISTLIVSGANVSTKGLKAHLRLLFRIMYILKRDPKVKLMIKEPNIGDDVLNRIRAKTLVLAGSRDMIREQETRHIAAAIPGSELRILEGEDHGSYIIHNEKIGRIILSFTQ